MRQLRTVQVIAVLALGASLGYLAAADRSASTSAGERPHVAASLRDAPPVSEKLAHVAASAKAAPPQELLLAQATPKAPSSSGNGKKPNILFIMGDDVGWFNIGAYHRGIMSGKTPNLDKLASQGMLFTDYYAEASCTAGRANF